MVTIRGAGSDGGAGDHPVARPGFEQADGVERGIEGGAPAEPAAARQVVGVDAADGAGDPGEHGFDGRGGPLPGEAADARGEGQRAGTPCLGRWRRGRSERRGGGRGWREGRRGWGGRRGGGFAVTERERPVDAVEAARGGVAGDADAGEVLAEHDGVVARGVLPGFEHGGGACERGPGGDVLATRGGDATIGHARPRRTPERIGVGEGRAAGEVDAHPCGRADECGIDADGPEAVAGAVGVEQVDKCPLVGIEGDIGDVTVREGAGAGRRGKGRASGDDQEHSEASGAQAHRFDLRQGGFTGHIGRMAPQASAAARPGLARHSRWACRGRAQWLRQRPFLPPRTRHHLHPSRARGWKRPGFSRFFVNRLQNRAAAGAKRGSGDGRRGPLYWADNRGIRVPLTNEEELPWLA